MGLLRMLITGAAVAGGVYYVTKKRPDGTSIADDLKAKAPDWINTMKNQMQEQMSKFKQTGKERPYPQRYDEFSPDPDPGYSS